ncbi:ATP-binding protein [Phytomonospora sp. NPDC050363]|uniref:ATP-binding protein n=1 Tax=Phytomonospora sp. NPDC050363 TaxID=3155642 RepID=UPI00340A9D6D
MLTPSVLIWSLGGVAVVSLAALVVAGVLLWRRTAAIEDLQFRLAESEATVGQMTDKLTEAAAAVAEAKREAVFARSYNARILEDCVHLAARVAAEIAVRRGIPGAAPLELRHPDFGGSAFGNAFDQVIEAVGKAVETAAADSAGAMRALLENALDGAVAALVRAQHDISHQQSTIGNTSPTALAAWTEVDGLVTLARRAVDRLRVLGGAAPGAQTADAPLADVLEAARGRVERHRVKHRHSEASEDIWLSGRLVEPVVMAVAELLDNGVKHSAGHPVSVEVTEVGVGQAITITDRGFGINSHQREYANALFDSGEIDLLALPNAVQLGWPLVASLARRYGFSVQVGGPSLYGGATVVVVIPRVLTTTRPNAMEHAPAYGRLARPPKQRTPSRDDTGTHTAVGQERTPLGLPVRRPAAPPATASGPSVGNADPAQLDAADMSDGLAKLGDIFPTDEGDQQQ